MHRSLFLLTISLLGCAFSFGVAYRIAQAEQSLLEEEFRHSAEIQAQMVSWHLGSAFDTLTNLGVLFQGSENVSPEEFAVVAEGMISRHREIKALEWVPVVNHPQRAEMESAWRLRYPGFTFSELVNGVMVEARPRQTYFPVYYVEPLAGNERAFGFDLGSEPVRLKTLQEARDQGEMRATGAIQLVQDGQVTQSVLVMLPVYRGMPGTLSSRRDALMGYVLGAFQIESLAQILFFNRAHSRIDFRLLDDSADGEVLVTVGDFDEAMTTWTHDMPLKDVAGRQWRLQARPQVGFFREQRTLMPWVIAVGGPLLVLILASMVYQLTQRNRAIAALVEQRTEELDEANRKLIQLTLTDSLTDVGNRRQFDQWLGAEWDAGRRSGRPLTLMLADVDFFKAYNDNYGHRAGDKALRQIATTFKTGLHRPRDLVARYGGEEFALLLPETADNVPLLAQALCDAIARLGIRHEHGGLTGVVTVSIGVATLVPAVDQTPENLVDLADQALYRAKSEGRNRVVCYGGKVTLQLAPERAD
ncbi:CHASE domain-containing protein [Ferrimonas balearica]|uniref:CHASE domain-containing protein n=1 Tax=Ferrimonas balearica TaxID=44012 RepID=UPI001C9977F3|nr:CHASE domain-containing protein [Ferrimonas balearica]MBY5921359.1 CHASE domain-containing protein [Ferrimonas balearica]MBY5995956.1 CHASE domain-containing protein [Ferrimonas balearica]